MGDLTNANPNTKPANAPVAEDVEAKGNNGDKSPAPQVTETNGTGDGNLAGQAGANNDDNEGLPDERTMLMQRAKLMGISFSGNIGVDALKAKIADRLAEKEPVKKDPNLPAGTNDEAHVTDENNTPPEEPVKKDETPGEIRARLRAENLRLIRIRIVNLDPKKANLPGEIVTVANEFLGTVKKYVPFGEKTDNGYHVPYVIFKHLKERTFLSIKVTKNSLGREVVSHKWVREFAIEELPPLTSAEIAKLAASQSAAGGLEDNEEIN